MGASFPFKTTADEYSWQLWNKQVYLYLAEFFRKAKFANKAPVSSATDPMLDESIDGYRSSGPDGEWELPCGASSATPSEYASYFKVYDASTVEDGCRIGVTDGGDTGTPTNCGVAIVTGKRIDVPAYTEAVESAGLFNVWAHAWLDAVTGNHAEIRVTDGATMNPPNNPNSGIAYQSRLLGRFTSVSDGDGGYVITSRNQDYLAGGELVIDNWGACTE